MAGKKKHRTLMAIIDETGGVEKIFEEISNGRTIASIAREFQVSRNMLSGILNKSEYRTQLREAQRQGAEQLADAALEIADNVPEESAAISKARERIAVRFLHCCVRIRRRLGRWMGCRGRGASSRLPDHG